MKASTGLGSVCGMNGLVLVIEAAAAVIALVWLLDYSRAIVAWDSSGLLSGGILSGGLHALTGPDHLAALLPSIVGKKWWMCLFLGSLWGMGHSCSSGLMAICGYFLEDSMLRYSFMTYIIQFADFAIGLTLVVIGGIGIMEATAVEQHPQSEEDGDIEAALLDHQASVEAASSSKTFYTIATSRGYFVKLLAVSSTIFLNGLLLGLSWDGLPSLAPALSAETWNGLFVFIAAYAIGTMGSMGFAALAIGACTSWLGSYTNDSIPKHLALSSSVVAAIVGVVWICQAGLRVASVDDREVIMSVMNHVMVAGAPLLIIAVIVGTIGGEVLCRRSLVSTSSSSSATTHSTLKANIHVV